MNGHPYENTSRQFFAPRPDVLADLPSATAPVKATFRVPFPDSRLRVKVAVIYSPVPSTIDLTLPFDITGLASTLWMGLEEIDWAGRIAGPIPTQNVIINPATGTYYTRAAPLSIPSDVNVMGFSQEFETGGDGIFGELTTQGPATGRWMLYTRYQPSGIWLPPDEWDSIRALCTPRVITRQINGGGNS